MMNNQVAFFEVPASDFKKATSPEGNIIALWEKGKNNHQRILT